jgi:hypothetical protein
MSKSIVSLDSARFNEAIRLNEGGSTFLGYLYAELVVEGVLDDGADLKIGMPDLQVRITADGAPRVDFPADLKEVRGEERWIARYFSANRETRETLTRLAFSLPAVSRAVERAERKRSAA